MRLGPPADKITDEKLRPYPWGARRGSTRHGKLAPTT